MNTKGNYQMEAIAKNGIDKVITSYEITENKIIFKEFVFHMDTGDELNWSDQVHEIIAFILQSHQISQWDTLEKDGNVKITIISADCLLN